MIKPRGGDVKSCLADSYYAESCMSAGATHDKYFMVVSTTCLARVMRISSLKMDQWLDGGGGF
jgi:hypothetical protein